MPSIKQFISHFGLDLKSSDITREPQYSRAMKNAEYRKNGNISKRTGFRARAGESVRAGISSYRYIAPVTGLESEFLIGVSDKAYKLIESSFTISYAGAEASVVIEIFFDTASNIYRCQITENTTLVLNTSLGLGVDELTPKTLADLKVEIDAIANFSATISGIDTIAAAFLDLVRIGNLAAGDIETTARSWEEIYSPMTTPLPGNNTFKDDTDFQLTSFSQINNVLFMSNGYDDQLKYDGQSVYRSGMPVSDAVVAAVGAVGVLNTTYRYKTVYTYYDAAGNLVEGNISEVSNDITPSTETVDITLDNIIASSGFNTNCAIATGAQVGVTTIAVDDGSGGNQTLQIGDTAYFFDGVSSAYVERKVTASTGVSIDIEGAAVDVLDNAVISANLRIGLYRNLDGGVASFLVEEIPNNSFTATQVYNDNKIDSALGIELLTPITPRDLPPKARYLAPFRNQQFVAGDLDNPNFVYWSSIDSPEYFATTIFALKLQSPNGDKLSGLSKSNEVMAIFENKAMHIISGDIPENNVRTDTITFDIGCVSHHTIQEVRGRLYFLSDRGVYSTVSGQLPIAESEIIEPVFDFTNIFAATDVPILKRAVAINDRAKEKYILYIPVEGSFDSELFTDKSITIVEDYFRKSWLLWDNMDFGGGAALYQNKVAFIERRRNTDSGTVRHYLHSQMSRNDNWDYLDHSVAVNFEYEPSWYHMNTPTQFKKFLRFKLFGANDTENNSFKVDVDILRNFQDVIEGQFTIDYGQGVEGYGISAYGTAPYGDTDSPNRKVKIGPIKAQAISFKIKNSEPLQNVDLLGWEVEFIGSYRDEMKE